MPVAETGSSDGRSGQFPFLMLPSRMHWMMAAGTCGQ